MPADTDGHSAANGDRQLNIAIIGVGLIGGSIGMAARVRLGATVTGWSRSRPALDRALQRAALDHAAGTLAQAVANAQAVFVCAPVGVLPAVIGEALAAAPADCVVTDVGSTKRSVVAAVGDPRFVGGHPLAGAETSGVEHAREDLFQDATWYLTPTPDTTGTLFERLHRLIRGLGARPTTIDAATHDKMLAAVSHLPHVFANLLVAQAAQVLAEESEQLPATGPSFRDATRVAGANSSIWTDIYLSNRDALIGGIDETLRQLGELRGALAAGDSEAITSWNEQARADRDRLLAAAMDGAPLHELRASVPNRPGVLAEIALGLGRAGVNILDMALTPSADNSQGVIALWFGGEEQAARAEQLIAALGFPAART